MPFDPNDPLGTDLSGVDDVDPNLTPVSGRLMLAQAIARRWITDPGELFYAPDYGAGLRRYLSGATDNVGALPALLENEARKDERVDDCKVAVSLVDETLTVIGRIEDAQGPFSLTLSLSTTALTLELLDK